MVEYNEDEKDDFWDELGDILWMYGLPFIILIIAIASHNDNERKKIDINTTTKIEKKEKIGKI